MASDGTGRLVISFNPLKHDINTKGIAKLDNNTETHENILSNYGGIRPRPRERSRVHSIMELQQQAGGPGRTEAISTRLKQWAPHYKTGGHYSWNAESNLDSSFLTAYVNPFQGNQLMMQHISEQK